MNLNKIIGGFWGTFASLNQLEIEDKKSRDIYQKISQLKIDYKPLIPNLNFEIRDDNINNIFAISDIHGDILPLIVMLRDCAKVIKKIGKTREVMEDSFSREFDFELDESGGLNVTNPNLKGYLNMPLYITNDDDKIVENLEYHDNLGYEWCGNTDHVVILGDMIDNWRDYIDTEPTDTDRRFGEYPFEEIKILRFINAINKSAFKSGGRIIKLVGNHEVVNITSFNNDNQYNKYISPYAQKNLINGVNRLSYFIPGNDGAKLLIKDGIGIAVKIYDFIFLHAGITEKYTGTVDNITTHLNLINSKLNEYLFNNYPSEESSLQQNYDFLLAENILSLTNTRDFGTHFSGFGLWGNALEKELKGNNSSMIEYCNYINTQLGKLGNPNHKYRLVVGHCQQNIILFPNNLQRGFNSPELKIKTSTFVGLDRTETNDTIETLTVPVLRSSQIIPNEEHPIGNIWGITMDCSINAPYFKEDGDNNPSIYRIDHSPSRAFVLNQILKSIKDTPKGHNKNKLLRRYLLSKVPQVLKISVTSKNTDGTRNYETKIIRSSMKNTIIHVPLNRTYIDEDTVNDIIEKRIPEIIPL